MTVDSWKTALDIDVIMNEGFLRPFTLIIGVFSDEITATLYPAAVKCEASSETCLAIPPKPRDVGETSNTSERLRNPAPLIQSLDN